MLSVLQTKFGISIKIQHYVIFQMSWSQQVYIEQCCWETLRYMPFFKQK